MSVIKGQNFRVFLTTASGSTAQAIACATSCSLHLSASLEDASTKDDTGNWQNQECVSKSWDGSAEGLVSVTTSETALEAFDLTELIGTTVTIKFSQCSGTNNRTPDVSGVSYTGSAIVSDVSLTAANRTNSQYNMQFQGVGALTKAEAE